MAVNNRNEADIAVDAVLVPTLTLAAHKTLLKESINSSTVFRKDVISSDTPAVGAVTVSFLSKDLSTITTSGDLVVSFSDIENGDVKYLAITKALTDEVTFSGATDVSQRRGYITSVITYVIYSISNKNGSVIVNSINIDNDSTGGSGELLIDVNWDMVTDSNVTVPYPTGVTFANIKTASIYIINDTSSTKRNLEGDINASGSPDGNIVFNSSGIFLGRRTGGPFDDLAYNSDPFIRGTLVVKYKP